MSVEVELIKLSPNNKCLQNLKQYRTGSARKGFIPGPGYRGGFPLNIQRIISELVSTGRPVLHLYSGRSDIGDVRVDLECPEATHNMTVEEFIKTDRTVWEWVILDPPYKIKRIEFLKDYADARPLTGNSLLRDRIVRFLRSRTNNVIWLDYCTPEIKGFTRKKVWLMVPANFWQNVRCMTWFTRSGPEMRLEV